MCKINSNKHNKQKAQQKKKTTQNGSKNIYKIAQMNNFMSSRRSHPLLILPFTANNTEGWGYGINICFARESAYTGSRWV